jgi:hypothetical protein
MPQPMPPTLPPTQVPNLPLLRLAPAMTPRPRLATPQVIRCIHARAVELYPQAAEARFAEWWGSLWSGGWGGVSLPNVGLLLAWDHKQLGPGDQTSTQGTSGV